MITPHQSPHNYSASNQDKERSKAQKAQGKDGIGNGVGGRRGIFGWEGYVDTHYLHNARSPHIRYTFLTHFRVGYPGGIPGTPLG